MEGNQPQEPGFDSTQINRKKFPVFKIFLLFVLLLVVFLIIFFGIRFFMSNNNNDMDKVAGARSGSSPCSSVGITFSKMNCTYKQNGFGYETTLFYAVEEEGASFSNLSYFVSFQSGNPSFDKISIPLSGELREINLTFISIPKYFHLYGDLITSDENPKRSCYSQTVSCILVGVIEENLQEEPQEEGGSGSIPPPPPLPD